MDKLIVGVSSLLILVAGGIIFTFGLSDWRLIVLGFGIFGGALFLMFKGNEMSDKKAIFKHTRRVPPSDGL
ncbi:MAG TPA: hypothetical protein VD689_00805 [Nitrosopumilaceae archaeon]|nr:hypothetical protein [Nitrosopumilaceae archaeon]